ncbi:olfactory receptor 1361-like isoform X2 [Sphaerodactylus townsendi]|uniref:olfactory receptor 1361-like isoform X2 n=1 Tax=Sphaerodactylus townsendi TaxID=933632 RepID=UPI0020267920|nr:olfactory receptor 1361-like isoform X2 [Sphaerodactylus townsendi]
MNLKNTTQVSEFLLRGFSSQPELQGFLFPLFLTMYVLNVLGNGTIIFVIRSDMQLLQSPMYYFLSQLAIADLCSTSTVVPKMLENLLSQKKTISYHGCIIQICFYGYFVNLDNFLLAAMAYDRYVAICYPLSYLALMSHKNCLQLATACWTLPLLDALLYTVLMARVEFCDPGEIPHFFCDIYPMLDISCSDTSLIELLLMTEGSVDILGPFVLILISYIFIFYAIMKIPSATGKRKAFSTCGSHLSVVVLFIGTLSWVYLKPHSRNLKLQDIVATVMYGMVTPMLNPFIYSLRNSEMKAAMRRIIRQYFH